MSEETPGPPPGVTTSPKRDRALGWGSLNQAWMKYGRSKARLIHLKEMHEAGVGHNMDEAFMKRSRSNRKSSKNLAKHERGWVRKTMEIKVRDEAVFL